MINILDYPEVIKRIGVDNLSSIQKEAHQFISEGSENFTNMKQMQELMEADTDIREATELYLAQLEKEFNSPAPKQEKTKKKKKLHTSQSKRKTGRKTPVKSTKQYPLDKEKFIKWFREFKFQNEETGSYFDELIDYLSNEESVSLNQLIKSVEETIAAADVREAYRWRSNFLMYTIINSKTIDEGTPFIYDPKDKKATYKDDKPDEDKPAKDKPKKLKKEPKSTKKEKKVKEPKAKEPDNTIKVEKVPVSVSYINRYRLMNGKTLPKSGRGSVLSLLNSLQKAIEEKLIRKDDKYAAEITTMQKSMVNLVNNWTGNRASKIEIEDYDKYMTIVRAYVVAPLTMLIKRFIKIQGKDKVTTEAANLLKAIDKHIEQKEIAKPDVADMIVSLNNYVEGKTDTIQISNHALNGLKGLAGYRWKPSKAKRREFAKKISDPAEKAGKKPMAGFETVVEPDLTITVGDVVETPVGKRGVIQRLTDKVAFIATSTGEISCQRKLLKKIWPSLNGPDVINSCDLQNMTFNSLGLKGKFAELIGDPAEPWSMMLYGSPGSGKSTLSIELAHTLASEYNRKVAYVAKEEGIGATIKEKFDRLNAYHENIDIYSNRLPENPEKYNYIFIDSVNEFGIEYDQLSKMQHDWRSKGINPVYVFKGTKDGSFRGSQEFEHLVDVSIKTDAGIAKTEKSRFGGKGALVIYKDDSQTIPKFSELTKAEGYRNKEKNKMYITKGDDGKFWVVTPAMAELMKAQGFEIF